MTYLRVEPAAPVVKPGYCPTCRLAPSHFLCYCPHCVAYLGETPNPHDAHAQRNAAIAAATTHRERRGWFFLGLAIGSIPALGIWFVTWLANH